MQVLTFPIGPLETNCYLASEDSQAIVVDPGGDPARIVDYLQESKLELTHILLTHLHCDHLYGVKALAEATGAKAYANPEDAFLLETEIGNGGLMGLPLVPSFSYEPLAPGEFQVLGRTCQALSTPGHTPGSLSYYFPDAGVLFAGDVLFNRSVGRSDFPGGSHETLVESIGTQLFNLPDDTVVYAGHGDPTTIGDEKMHNPFLTAFRR